MPIQSRYQGGDFLDRRIPLVAASLDAFFNERARMNDEARAAEEGEDPEKLAALELKAREDLNDLQRALEESSRQQKNDASEFLLEYMKQIGANKRTSAEVSGRWNIAKLGAYVSAAEIAEKTRKKLDADTALSDRGAETVPLLVETYASRGEAGPLVSAARALALSEKAGGVGDPRYDGLVREIERGLVLAGKPDMADAFVKEMNPAAAAEGMTANEYFVRKHDPESVDEMQEKITRLTRTMGAGIPDRALDQALARQGINVQDYLGPTTSTETRERTRGASDPVGGAVSLEGSPAALRAFAESRQSGRDPQAAMLDAIKAQAAFADELAQRRRLASERRSAYPRANRYVANPNTYSPAVVERPKDEGIRWERSRGLESVMPPTLDVERDWRAQSMGVPDTPAGMKPSAGEMLRTGKRAGGDLADPLVGSRFQSDPKRVAEIEEALGSDDFDVFVESYNAPAPAKPTPAPKADDDFDAFMESYK